MDINNFDRFSDIALECAEKAYRDGIPDSDGIELETVSLDGIKCDRLTIRTELGERKLSKPRGRYVTLEIGKIQSLSRKELAAVCSVCAKELQRLLPKGKSCLLAALGNRSITADSQGPLCADGFLVTRHIKEHDCKLFESLGLFETACIIPGVLGCTGVEAAWVVRAVADRIRPDFVIAVDSLAAGRTSRVGTTLQITDTGISPGSGIGNHRTALNEHTLGIPVIAMGIPTVVDAVTVGSDILEEYFEKSHDSPIPKEARDTVLADVLSCGSHGYFVTPKDADKLSEYAGLVLSMTINKALNPGLGFGEMREILE